MRETRELIRQMSKAKNHVSADSSNRLSGSKDRELSLVVCIVVVGHHRRHAVHFNVTAHPTAQWKARQIAEAFPWDSARIIYCTIAIVFTEQHSISELVRWESWKC